MTKRCDKCQQGARYEVFAAYDEDSAAIHPTLARYPLPMIRACGLHLASLLDGDNDAPLSTGQWLVRPILAFPGTHEAQ